MLLTSTLTCCSRRPACQGPAVAVPLVTSAPMARFRQQQGRRGPVQTPLPITASAAVLQPAFGRQSGGGGERAPASPTDTPVAAAQSAPRFAYQPACATS